MISRFITFVKAAKDRDVSLMKKMIDNDEIDLTLLDSYALRQAAKNGYLEVVCLLLSDYRVDPSARDYSIIYASLVRYCIVAQTLLRYHQVDLSDVDNYTIAWASEGGHLEVFKLLLSDPQVDPSKCENASIRLAAENGHLEVVRLLLSDHRVDPSDLNNDAIQFASENGHLDVVRLLLSDPRVDPSADDNNAIQLASENGHLEIVKLLLNDSRVINGDQEALTHPKIQEILEENRATKTAIMWNCGTIRKAWRYLGSMIAEKVSI